MRAHMSYQYTHKDGYHVDTAGVSADVGAGMNSKRECAVSLGWLSRPFLPFAVLPF